MRKTFITIISCLFALTINAQEWVGISKNASTKIQETLISSSEKKVVVDVKIDGFYKQSVRTQQGEQLVISGEGMAYMPVKGAPNLPMYPISMIVGDKAEMEVSIVKSEYVDFENIEVAPSKGNFSRQINPADVPYTYGDMYQQDAFYPAQQAVLGDPYILRDFRGQYLWACWAALSISFTGDLCRESLHSSSLRRRQDCLGCEVPGKYSSICKLRVPPGKHYKSTPPGTPQPQACTVAQPRSGWRDAYVDRTQLVNDARVCDRKVARAIGHVNT